MPEWSVGSRVDGYDTVRNADLLDITGSGDETVLCCSIVFNFGMEISRLIVDTFCSFTSFDF